MSRPSSVVGSTGRASHPARDATASSASSGGSPDSAARRTGSAPGAAPGPFAELVAVAVEAQVEARARADLEQPQRQSGQPRDLQEAAQQRGAASGLVGLHRMVDQFAQLAGVGRDRLEKAGQGSEGSPPADGNWAARTGAAPARTRRCTAPIRRSASIV